MSIRIERWRTGYGMGAWQPGACTSAFRVSVSMGPSEVNFRVMNLWRPDNRYPGSVTVRRHESGGLEFSFDALRHGAKPRPPIVVAPNHVRKFILSCLECCELDEPD